MPKYLDEAGVEHLWENIEEYVQGAVADLTETATDLVVKNGFDSTVGSYLTILKLPRSKYRLDSLNNPGTNVRDFIDAQTSGIYINGRLKGAAVSNGAVVQESATSTSEYWYIFGVRNGEPSVSADPNRTLTATQLIADGYTFAIGVWSPVILNGVAFDTTTLPTSDSNYDYVVNGAHPRTIIGWDNSNWYLVVVDGRLPFSSGLTYAQMLQVCTTYGIGNAINADGGGSTQLWTPQPTMNWVFVATDKTTKPNEPRIVGLIKFTEI